MPRHSSANGFYVRGTSAEGEVRYFNQLDDRWARFRSKHTRHPNEGSAKNEIWRIFHNELNPTIWS